MERRDRDGQERGGGDNKARELPTCSCCPGSFKQSSQASTHVAMVTEPQVCSGSPHKGQILKQHKRTSGPV